MSQRKRRRIDHPVEPRRTWRISPEMPLIVSSYARIVIYGVVWIGLLLFVYSCFQAASLEIKLKMQEHNLDLEREIMQCADKFNEYQCHSKDQLSPLVQTYCTQLEQCLQRSVTGQQTKIVVGVYGEIINAFIEPLTLKSMLFICISVFLFFGVSGML